MGTITMSNPSFRTFRGPKYSNSTDGSGGSDNTKGAMQGYYKDDSSNYSSPSRVGKIYLKTVGGLPESSSYTPNSFTITSCSFGKAGSSRAAKTLYFYSTFEEPRDGTNSTNLVPSGYIGSASLTKAYGNTLTNIVVTVNGSSGYNNLKTALQNQVLYIYSGETTTATSSSSYSTNYLKVTNISISVTFTQGATAYYYTGGTWIPCHLFYYSGGWQQVGSWEKL